MSDVLKLVERPKADERKGELPWPSGVLLWDLTMGPIR